MKILAFAATSSSKSINRQLVHYAASQVVDQHEGAETEILDINDYELPLFSEDREAEIGQPELAKAFIDKIANSDAIIISFAEHNGSYTVAYKNIFDWASRINPKVFQNKSMIMLATSPGPGGASSVLTSATASAPYFDGHVKASLSIPSFYDNFDSEQGRINNDDMNKQLLTAISNLFDSHGVELQQIS
jgi:chromate reductase, NAD(P)H dehydrogenase (quinone)